MDELIGKGEVADGVVVFVAVEIVGVAAESLAQSMTVVEHRRDAVEAEPVEVEFFNPVFAVGK